MFTLIDKIKTTIHTQNINIKRKNNTLQVIIRKKRKSLKMIIKKNSNVEIYSYNQKKEFDVKNIQQIAKYINSRLEN